MTFSQSFAEEKKVEGIQDVHKKYCEQKVEDACDALKPQAAQVQFQFNNEQVAMFRSFSVRWRNSVDPVKTARLEK